MSNETKKKRYYKKGQLIWSIKLKKVVEVDSVNIEDLTITVLETDSYKSIKHTFPLWSVDVLKYNAKKQLETGNKNKEHLPTVHFAKVRESAIIPSKRDEDAGYDVYANLEPKEVDGKVVHEIYCPTYKTTLVPTGIAMALPKTHYFNTKHERGSTGKIGMSVLSGCIDSGYRGEIFIAITPLHKDILITSEVTETVNLDLEDVILYPYSKAICQGTIDLVPQVNIEEVSFEELQGMKSERMATKLGQSGK